MEKEFVPQGPLDDSAHASFHAGLRRDLPPGFTPGARDIGPMLAELETADERRAAALARALCRAPVPARAAALAALDGAVRPLRGRLVALLGRLLKTADTAERAVLIPRLITLTVDTDLKTQLNAVGALGAAPDAAVETALLALWRPDIRPELRRALLRSLGKAGGARTRALLEAAQPADDSEMQRLANRARLILDRTASRAAPGALRAQTPLAGAYVELRCRAGLASLLADEARESGIAPVSLGLDRVTVVACGSLADLKRLRIATDLVLPLDTLSECPADGGDDRLAAAAVAAMAGTKAQGLLAALTDGTPRYRIAWEGASRGRLWALAQALTARVPGAVNDPTAALWELRLETAGGHACIGLVPRRLEDRRFAYRIETVPASSHPTLAAALARVAGVRADDVVWDPFVGAGAELIERARAGAYRSLAGTDVSGKAIMAARANAHAAGLAGIDLAVGDSLAQIGRRPTLIITNPPMGRRVARGELKPLLDRFVAHAARELAPGGRLVWISPLADRTASALGRAGLRVSLRTAVDMGGFTAEIQRAEKPARP